jgi:hypothetical protein
MIRQSKLRFFEISLIAVLLSACGGQDAAQTTTKVNAVTASKLTNLETQSAQSVKATNQAPETLISTSASTSLSSSQNAEIAEVGTTYNNAIGIYVERFLFSIYPKVATQNVKTDFVVESLNLPQDAALVFDSLICEAPTNRTATGFNQKCTMGNGTTALGKLVVNGGLKGVRPVLLAPAIVEPLYTGNLPDTGITSAQCYGIGSDILISCTSAAAIALNPKQDGMVGRDVTAPAAADGKLGFSYSDVPKPTGGVYAKTECVKDNITGLTWEGKTLANMSDLRSVYKTYTNFTSTDFPVKWNGSAYVNPTQADIDSGTNAVGYKNYVNSIALCGYTDWRLPEIIELTGIFITGNLAVWGLDRDWFPESSASQNYWTGTDAVNDSGLAIAGSPVSTIRSWSAYPDGGIIRNLRENQLQVKLVRGNIPSPSGRYSYTNGGAEVVDGQTGLIWKRCAEGSAWSGSACAGIVAQLTQENALIHANTQTGWRLPNKTELISILDFSRGNPTMNTAVYPLSYIPSAGAPFLDSNAIYWSSTPDANHISNSSWYVSAAGSMRSEYRSWQNQVRLVRNAP